MPRGWGGGDLVEDRLDFSLLQQRLSVSARSLPRQVQDKPAHFVAFDLLAVAGHDIRQEPLRDRRALLEELAKEWSGPLELSPVTADPEKAAVWFRDLPATGVEGLVIKGAGQSYDGGQRRWLKVKHRETLDVICAAVIGPLAKPQAVVAGLPIDGELRMVGRSVPLKRAAAKLLGARLQPSGTPCATCVPVPNWTRLTSRRTPVTPELGSLLGIFDVRRRFA